jgi:hypothetical protein
MNPISETFLKIRSIFQAYENTIHSNEHDFHLIEWDQENLLYHRKEYLLFEEGDARYRMENNITNTPRLAICGDKLNREIHFLIFYFLCLDTKKRPFRLAGLRASQNPP